SSEIAARMVILAALVRRAMLELPLDIEADDEDSAEGQHFDVKVAFDQPFWTLHLSGKDREVLFAPVGSLGERRALDVSWQIEALAAVASVTLPGFAPTEPWIQADIGRLLAVIPEPPDDLKSFVESISSPSDDDAAFERERAELWTWRT